MKIYTVKKARKEYPEDNIKPGDTYYYVSPKGRKKERSKSIEALGIWCTNYMKLFRGELASNMEDWETRKEGLQGEDERDTLLDEVNEFLEEKQSNLENVPESLQESHILNEQIEQLEEFIEELESIEFD